MRSAQGDCLKKEIDRKQKDKTRTEAKISNPKFINKAPAPIVQKEKDKLTEITSALEKLDKQKLRLESL